MGEPERDGDTVIVAEMVALHVGVTVNDGVPLVLPVTVKLLETVAVTEGEPETVGDTLPVTERLGDPLPVSDAVMVTLAPDVALLEPVADRLNVAVTDGDSDGELQGEALSVTDGVNVGDSDGELHGDGDSVTLAE